MSIKFVSKLQEYPKAVGKRLDLVVRKIAFDIQANAQDRCPVDLGALKNSMYVADKKSDGYADAIVAVQSANPKAVMYPDTPVTDELTATAFVGVEYGFWVENGTTRMAAQPYWQPAIEDNERPFISACEQVIKQATTDTTVK